MLKTKLNWAQVESYKLRVIWSGKLYVNKWGIVTTNNPVNWGTCILIFIFECKLRICWISKIRIGNSGKTRCIKHLRQHAYGILSHHTINELTVSMFIYRVSPAKTENDSLVECRIQLMEVIIYQWPCVATKGFQFLPEYGKIAIWYNHSCHMIYGINTVHDSFLT